MQQNFRVYKSAAGSGKTYTLVKEYLKLVLTDPSRSKHILAITFTNAAAAGMKERIIGSLGAITRAENAEGKKGQELIAEIIKDLSDENMSQVPSQTQIIANAKRVLKQILHQYTDFAVSTIDSFVHKVIRNFAFDLHIPYNVQVELDTESMLNQAVDLLIKQAGHNKMLTDLLVSFMLSQADEELDTRIEQKIAALAFNLVDEDSIPYLEKLKEVPLEQFRETAGRLRKSTKAFEKSIRDEAMAALRLVREKNLPAEAFYRGRSGIISYFDHLEKGNIRDKIHPNTYVIKTVSEDKWFAGKASEEQKQAIEAIKDQLISHYEAISKLVGKGVEAWRCEMALLNTIYPLALLSEVEKLVEEIKTEEVTLHISDFNKLIASIIADQPVPFIYERIGERYLNYMIDEFQDTSLLQWQNLLPLVANALAGGDMSLVVGDGKQAIYRFRNGDVEQFASLPDLTEGIRGVNKEDWEVALKNNFREIELDTNWRSAKAIVSFNNRFFESVKNLLHDDLKNIYTKVEQKVRPDKPEGYVQVDFLDGSGRQEYEKAQLDRILSVIQQCTDAGHPLRDITVLCRAHREASMVAEKLLANNIPVISEESLLLSHSDEVNICLATLKLLANPHDTISAVEMLALLHRSGFLKKHPSLHDCIKAAGLYSHQKKEHARKDSTKGIEKVLHEHGIAFSFHAFAHLNIYDTCETLIRIFFATVSPPNPFVAFFMDAIFEFSHQQALSYDDFLDWWEKKGRKYSIVVPEGTEAVQVMTVHKSKGLQFPVVIHPFADQKPNRLTRKGLWTDESRTGIKDLPAQWLELTQKNLEGTVFEKDLEWEQAKTFLDLLNATYVALTRPSQKLFIISKKEDKSYKPLSVNGMLYNFLQQEHPGRDNAESYSEGTFEEATGQKEAEEKEAENPYRHMISELWSRSMRMRSHQKERSILLDSEDPAERGNLLHRAMEDIRHEEDVKPVLHRMVSTGEINEELADKWEAKITTMLKEPSITRYFARDASIKTEAGIFNEKGALYRPDRVVFLEQETAVIDYKSGKEHQSHHLQMNTYAGILQRMGYPSIKKIILYLDKGVARIL